MTESFLPISDYEGFYEVGDLGQIRSVDRIILNSSKIQKLKGKQLKTFPDKDDYPIVVLSKNGITSTKKVHRLVAIAHIPNPCNLPEVNHIKGIKKDCRAVMLEWSTKSDNMKHSYRELGHTPVYNMKGRLGGLSHFAKKVFQFTIDDKLIKEWGSLSEVTRSGIPKSGMMKCLHGVTEIYKGYKWRYDNFLTQSQK